MKKIKFLSVAMTICLAAGTLVGCGSNQDIDSTETAEVSGTGETTDIEDDKELYADTVNVTFTTWIGYAPMFIAKEKGIFEKNGVDVNIQIIESAGDIKAAAMAGQVQAYANTVDTVTMAAGAGLDFVQVLALDTSDGGDGVVAKKEYESIADLKGKSIALDTTGGPSLFYFNYLIQKENLSMDDFNVQNMSSGDAGSAFVGGKVEAAVTWEPWLTNAKDTDFGTVLYSSKDEPGLIADTLCFSRDFIEKYHDTVQAVVDSWFEALEFIETNQEEAYEIMAESQGMTVEDFEATLPAVSYYDEDMNKKYFTEGRLEEICQQASDLWVELDFMENAVEPADIIDSSFVLKE